MVALRGRPGTGSKGKRALRLRILAESLARDLSPPLQTIRLFASAAREHSSRRPDAAMLELVARIEAAASETEALLISLAIENTREP